jgi:PEP-CTERM motif
MSDVNRKADLIEMKFPERFVGKLAVVLALTCTPLEAAPITFYTGDGGDVVNGVAAVNIAPHPAWGDVSQVAGLAAGSAKWISFVDSGYGRIVLPNAESRDLGDQTAQFTRPFDFSSETTLRLWILADDTAIVRLLGPARYVNTLFNAYPWQIDPCAPGGSGTGLGCVQADTGIVTVPGLTAGQYTLEVNAFQTNGNVFGAQYAGTVESVPEPASLLLLATGLGAVAIRRRLTASRGNTR